LVEIHPRGLEEELVWQGGRSESNTRRQFTLSEEGEGEEYGIQLLAH